jgi:hypothetical protein
MAAVLATAAEVAAGMAFLHAHAVVHGDLTGGAGPGACGPLRGPAAERARAAGSALAAFARQRRDRACPLMRGAVQRRRGQTCVNLHGIGPWGHAARLGADVACHAEREAPLWRAPRGPRLSRALWRAAGNVLLASADAPHGFCAKVCDFGLARSMDVASRIDTRTYGDARAAPYPYPIT